VVPGRRPLPHDLLGLVDLKTRQLQVLDDSVGEHVSGTVGHVLLKQPAQQIPAAADGEADRENELIPEAAAIHGEACSRSVLLW
jgi:hypothetical protein